MPMPDYSQDFWSFESSLVVFVGVSVRIVQTVEVSITFGSFLDKISFKCTVGDKIRAVIPLNCLITSYFITFISIKCSKAVLVTVIFSTSDNMNKISLKFYTVVPYRSNVFQNSSKNGSLPSLVYGVSNIFGKLLIHKREKENSHFPSVFF